MVLQALQELLTLQQVVPLIFLLLILVQPIWVVQLTLISYVLAFK